MEHFYADAHSALEYLLKCDDVPKKHLQKYLAKQIWSSADRSELLSTISAAMLKPSTTCFRNILKSLGPIAADLMFRCTRKIKGESLSSIKVHERICVILAWACTQSLPNIDDFCMYYLKTYGPPFKRIAFVKNLTIKLSKKKKSEPLEHFSDVLEATYLLVTRYPSLLDMRWPWSDLLECYENQICQDARDQIFLRKILFRWTGHIDYFNPESEEERLLQLSCHPVMHSGEFKDYPRLAVSTQEKILTHTNHAFVSSDLTSYAAPVCGILLQRMDVTLKSDSVASQLVMTSSCKSVLKDLALAIAESQAVLLQGPVGCGKTALVDYLGTATGRFNPPQLSKIQLSDDTDSKTLTGAYTCTAVPGEFVWQPGLLVEACVKGYWVLLEDIDRAPMDIISLLLPLIESRHLNVPGRSAQSTAVSSQFRLFMTRRLGASGAGARSVGVDMICKHATVLNIPALPREDVEQIVLADFPNLKNVTRRLLKVYQDLQEMTTSSTQRKPSMRDLLKWCRRVSHHVTLNGDKDIGSLVALAGIDCFVAPAAKPGARVAMAELICSELSISSDKADYYCNSYKPQVDVEASLFNVGRASLPRMLSEKLSSYCERKQPFAETRHSCVLLERVACCVESNEPILLVGETGVGKTSALQYLAQETGRKLHVVNMSQQSSSSDLLGGYKPAQMRHFVLPVKESFCDLFMCTFSRQQNRKFLSHVQNCLGHKRYNDLWQLMYHSTQAAVKKLKASVELDENLLKLWKEFSDQLRDLKLKLKSDSPIAFNFVEGQLSQCIKRGDWILLDEINLASPDTLECLSSVLESESGSIMLMERGDAKPVHRSKDFRLFAAMNPATDVGKRNLPDGVRNRFTEIFVDEPTQYNDLSIIVGYYIQQRSIGGSSVIDGIVRFYQEVRKLAEDKLVDGCGHKPHYSLRTLCRALRYVAESTTMSLGKALYEGFCLSFLTALDRSSHPLVIELIVKHIVGRGKLKSIAKQVPSAPEYPSVVVGGHHVRRGQRAPSKDPDYIITESVKENLQDLARPVSYGKYPILIQGETSTGKTSLVRYLAALTGNKVVRINNHEHTDLQEYVGSYGSDVDGRLAFHDGPLVTAMREGHWVILDELNLAPTDILEALNRVLDDNREIFITDTQEVVRAHPGFQLFATQNPPGLYGGRKVLSRAFRNRFVELHFDEIPPDELKVILNKRCQLSPKHSNKLVKIMLDLQSRRRSTGLFAGKHGYITLRDLFKWAERHRKHEPDSGDYFDWEQHLADDGFLLLAGRVRKKEEEKVIEEVISKHLGRKINRDKLFDVSKQIELEGFSHVVWTEPMKRLFTTLQRALRFNEPVLLVGETGGGKTTACQMTSALMGKKLSIINCHANTEAGDFIGGLRPVRSHQNEDNDITDKKLKLFDWVDGPLVKSMCDGSHLLVDEISLADDSVLERLNSVLEPERSLVIPDKISSDTDTSDAGAIQAKPGFQFLATMNPGGDFGKKELSPALRNRMTEIWCDVSSSEDDLISIIRHNLRLTSPMNGQPCNDDVSLLYARMIVEFVNWFKTTLFGKRFVISVRDLLTWTKFINLACQTMDLPSCLVHGACLVYIDGFGSGLSGGLAAQSKDAKQMCIEFLHKQLLEKSQMPFVSLANRTWIAAMLDDTCEKQVEPVVDDTEKFGIGSFSILKGPLEAPKNTQFSFKAKTTCQNALRVMRALQLSKPILLEGSPGGGKTSLVSAIARSSGHQLVRINLSEQTDASDLFGEDLPVENGVGGQFSWRDGPLLNALKSGHWVVLDELNLASQSVLESLNSVFDHRGELYVPELGQTFQVKTAETRIFACQNPLQEGGGRKGLPKSFLNRFTQVYIENLASSDLVHIVQTAFPQISPQTSEIMVQFNSKVYEELVVRQSFGHQGSPWEFNLRDLTRWGTLVTNDILQNESQNVSQHAYLVYMERLRTHADQNRMLELMDQFFGTKVYQPTGHFHITQDYIQIGNVRMERFADFALNTSVQYNIVPSILHQAESLAVALNENWPCMLTGEAGSGKSRLVKTMAALTGHRLKVLATNSAMDAMELLGGYEQADQIKNATNCLLKAKRELLTICRRALGKFVSSAEKLDFCEAQSLIRLVENLDECASQLNTELSSGAQDEQFETLKHSLLSIQKEVEQTSGIKSDALERCLTVISRKQHHGTYEWIDSILVKAVQNGDWLLVDDANFCLPSVLDRLNALLEPDGVLSITERGLINAKIVTIVPHVNFRLIFALDPAHGDLSRAMRNRCLEINFPIDKSETDCPSATEALALKNAKTVDMAEQTEVQLYPENHEDSATNRSLAENDKFLATCRRGLQDQLNKDKFNVERKQCSDVILPSVEDFALRPVFSNVQRQMMFLNDIKLYLSKSVSSDGFVSFIDQVAIEANHTPSRQQQAWTYFCLKALCEPATGLDREIRTVIFKQCSSRALGSDSDYNSFFAGLLDTVFTCISCLPEVPRLPNDEPTILAIPWHPLWNQHLLPNSDFSPKLNAISLSVLCFINKFDEELCIASKQTLKSAKSRRKRSAGKFTCFQLSKSYNEGSLQVSDLPHPVLICLQPLYNAWNSFLSSMHPRYTCDAEVDYVQSLLLQISFFWKYFFASQFSLPDFTACYLHLKSLVQEMVVPNEELAPLNALFDEMDSHLRVGDGSALEGAIQSRFCDKPFADLRHYSQYTSVRNFAQEFSDYCSKVFLEDGKTPLTWSDVRRCVDSLSNRFITVQNSVGCNSTELDDDVDQTLEFDLCAIEELSVTDKLVKLSGCGLPTSVEVAAFGINHNEKASWPVTHCLAVLSSSGFGKSIFDVGSPSNLFNADIWNSVELDLFRSLGNKELMRSCILKMCERFSLSYKNDDSLERKTAKGSGLFMLPVVSQSLHDLLHIGDESLSNLESDINLNSQFDFSPLKRDIPIGEVSSKIEQVKLLQRTLWDGSSLLCDRSYRNICMTSFLGNCFELLLNSALGSFSKLSSFEESAKVLGKDYVDLRRSLFASASAIRQKLSFHDADIGALLGVFSTDEVTPENEQISLSKWGQSVLSSLNKMTGSLKKLTELVTESSISEEDQKQKNCLNPRDSVLAYHSIGEAFVFNGLFLLNVVSPINGVDPLEQRRLKLNSLTEAHELGRLELKAQNNFHKKMTGRALFPEYEEGWSEEDCHDLALRKIRHLAEISAQHEELAKECGYRPEHNKFPELSSACQNFLSLFGNCEAMEKIVTQLQDKARPVLGLSMEETMQSSLDSFSKQLEKNFAAYPDFVQPLRHAIVQIKFGLSLTRQASKIRHTQDALFCSSQFIFEEFLSKLLRQDSQWDVLQLSQNLSHAGKVIKDVNLSNFEDFVPRVLTKVLLDINSQFLKGNCHLWKSLLAVLNTVNQLWMNRQEQQERKREKEASMFKYKAQVHDDINDLDEEIELKEMFPDFEEDLGEFREPEPSLDSDQSKTDSAAKEKSPYDSSLNQLFYLAVVVHSRFVSLHDRGKDNKDKSADPSDVQESMLYAHQLCAKLSSSTFGCVLGGEIDYLMLKSHVVRLAKIKDSLTCQPDAAKKLNLYKDAYPFESSQCLPVLNSFKVEVEGKLLPLYPDHPVLLQIVVIISRILSFSVHNPLMKFVHGLELLLEKSQEWERNASTELSICIHLENVTHVILRWRKLELKSWNHLLDEATLAAAGDTSKWWFHIFQLVRDNAEKGSTDILEVVKSLQQFVESSTIVEFVGRVNLLSTFQQHMELQSTEKANLSKALRNMHRYYRQFQISCEERIAALRKPIEKELKNFVKIAKWNDINFYAVKESIAKTHRTLFKFAKKFKSALLEPVHLNVLKSSPQSSTFSNSNEPIGVKISRRMQGVTVAKGDVTQTTIDACDVLSEIWGQSDDSSEPPTSLLPRLGTVAKKLTKHAFSWRKASSTWYPPCLLEVEETTGDVIENFVALRKLEPATAPSGDEEQRQKRLSEAKHIQARKRKSLSDLFKLLRLTGLSYRKGVVWKKSVSAAQLMLTSSPTGRSVDGNDAVKTIDFVDDYFYRLLARWSALQTSLHSPNKEVGSSNLERMNGFTNHLFMLATKQRDAMLDLSEMERLIENFSRSSSNLTQATDCYIPKQQSVLNYMRQCVSVSSSWVTSLERFKVVLQSCPETKPVSDGESFSSVNSSSYLSWCHGDTNWKEAMEFNESNLTRASQIHSTLNFELKKISGGFETQEDLREGCFLTGTTLKMFQNIMDELESSSVEMKSKFGHFFANESGLDDDQSNFTHSPLMIDIVETCQQISEFSTRSKHADFNGTCDVDTESLLCAANNLVHSTLIAVQDMKTSLPTVELDEEGLRDGQLVKHVHSRCLDDVKNLNLAAVRENVCEVACLIRSCNGEQGNTTRCLLRALDLFLGEYRGLVREVASTLSAAHRSTCKLAYILSTIFAEITTKGFCPPADVEEELAGDKGELKEVEDAGIGEGQGSKDVSDQIEEEDQVEDVPGEKQEQSEDQDEDIPEEDNAIEMSGDFEGQMHDPEQREDDDNESESDENEEQEELDKQMGDLGENSASDKLDERMWGSEDEEEEEEDGAEDKREEKGAGVDPEKSEMAAKDNEIGKDQSEKEESKKEETPEENLGDQSEFDPNERDDNHEQDNQTAPEEMDIPDDLNLDDNDSDGDKDTAENENPDEIDATMNDEVKEEKEPSDEKDAEKSDSDSEEVEGDIGEDGDPSNNEEDINKQEEPSQDDSEARDKEQEEDDDDDKNQGAQEEMAEESQEQKDPPEQQQNDEEKQDDQEENGAKDNKMSANPQPSEELETADETEEKEKISRKQASESTENAEQHQNATEQVEQENKLDGEEDNANGAAPSSEEKSESSSDMMSRNATSTERKEQISQEEMSRDAGRSDAKRSLGDAQESQVKRLRTLDSQLEDQSREKKHDTKRESDIFQHMNDDQNGHDNQTLDAATDLQIEEQKNEPEDKKEGDEEEEDLQAKRSHQDLNETPAIEMIEGDQEHETTTAQEDGSKQEIVQQPPKPEEEKTGLDGDDEDAADEQAEARDLPSSSIHTQLHHVFADEALQPITAEEIAEVRKEMEEQLREIVRTNGEIEAEDSSRMWHQYQSLTQPLAQQLSEQLRLILEPTQTAKLKGDYRSGRRLNMRKVIPYIASGFRKDKIWLRRSKPSKRAYQVMLAVDDSSSMADNHTKQLAFESLATISTALSTLEVGQLAVCSFGEDARLLHDFTQPFTDQSGARVLQQCSFKQEQTRIAKLLNSTCKLMKAAQQNYTSSADPRIAQLLLIISDGRGLYIEGKDKVLSAVRAARNCGVFIAFVILDNPNVNDSILDVKVPVFKPGQMPEIRSYMEDFPFPFYVIIRDVNALPDTLSEALRQWFELVTSES